MDESGRQLLLKITASVGDAGMEFGHLATCPLAIPEALARLFVAPLQANGVIAGRYFGLIFGAVLIPAAFMLAANWYAAGAMVVAIGLILVASEMEFRESTILDVYLDAVAWLIAGVTLSIVVARAVYSPGRVTIHRVLGGILLYLTIGLTFVALFGLVSLNVPEAFKGLEPLLHAVRLVPPEALFRLLVAGGPRTARWERLARRLGVADRVRFIGYCADTRNCYFTADFLVHPTFYDPCSLVVLEALACALPVITTRANGASELLHPLQEGYVLDDPHDHERLAWCMAQLCDPVRRAACAQAARRTGSQWTFEDHYRLLLQVFGEAAARKQAA